MPKTSKFNIKTIGVPQHGTAWCIPASIENLLLSEGASLLSQEEIIFQYLLKNAHIKTLKNGKKIDLHQLQRFQVLEMFRCEAIPNASFQTFTPIVNSYLQKSDLPLRLSYKEKIRETEYLSEVENILSKDKPVLISAGNANSWHITIVYESNGQELWSYDPGRDQHIIELTNNYNFSHDILYID